MVASREVKKFFASRIRRRKTNGNGRGYLSEELVNNSTESPNAASLKRAISFDRENSSFILSLSPPSLSLSFIRCRSLSSRFLPLSLLLSRFHSTELSGSRNASTHGIYRGELFVRHSTSPSPPPRDEREGEKGAREEQVEDGAVRSWVTT